MKYICSWSGGKDSTATIILARKEKKPLDEIIFSEVMFDLKRNISGEHLEHIEFINETIPKFEKWGYRVVKLRAELDYITLFNRIYKRGKHIGKKYGFSYGQGCWVNSRLKIAPIKKYINKLKKEEQGGVMQYIGLASDELKRLAKLGVGQKSLLAEYNYNEVMAYELCRREGMLSPIYNHVKRGGCWFCPNGQIKEFAYTKLVYPNLWNELKQLSKVENLFNESLKRDGKKFNEVDRLVDLYLASRAKEIELYELRQ